MEVIKLIPTMKKLPWTLYISGAFALVFIISASECQNETIFVPFAKELCTDKIDNDGNGLIDCDDSECARECKVKVSINPISSPITIDSLAISGTQFRASAMTVSVEPGYANTAIRSGNTWQTLLTKLTILGDYTVRVIGVDSAGKRDTAIATFQRK